MKDLILLKIGGSLLTDKRKEKGTLNVENLHRIAKEIKEGFNSKLNSLIIIHGAGSYGHPIVQATGINNGIKNQEQVLAFAQTQKLQNELNVLICEELEKNGLPAIPFQPSASATMRNKKLVALNTDLLRNLLEISLIPVLFGVPAYDEVQRCSILSGDQIITYLATKLGPKRVILATDVPGVLNEKGEIIKKIDSINFETIQRLIRQSKVSDVTGGMLGKIKELFQIKGLVSEIIGGDPGIIQKCLKGEIGLGTLIENR